MFYSNVLKNKNRVFRMVDCLSDYDIFYFISFVKYSRGKNKKKSLRLKFQFPLWYKVIVNELIIYIYGTIDRNRKDSICTKG